jgi:hypothetical protein
LFRNSLKLFWGVTTSSESGFVQPSFVLLDYGRGGVGVCSSLTTKGQRDLSFRRFVNSPITNWGEIIMPSLKFITFIIVIIFLSNPALAYLVQPDTATTVLTDIIKGVIGSAFIYAIWKRKKVTNEKQHLNKFVSSMKEVGFSQAEIKEWEENINSKEKERQVPLQMEEYTYEDIPKNILIDYEVRHQLSYKQMLLLANLFGTWATDIKLTPEESASRIVSAKGLRQLAKQVGEEWAPPEPENLSLLGFLARQYEEADFS